MPRTHLALLRGINVGTAKRIAMADLRDLVASLGYHDVATLLNSGNVVFSARGAKAKDPAPVIQKAILKHLGVDCRVIALSAPELSVVMKKNPFLEIANDHSRMMVGVFADDAARDRVKPLLKEDLKPGVLAMGARVAYYWCPDGILDSKLGNAIAKIAKDTITARNWATMMKIQNLMNEATE